MIIAVNHLRVPPEAAERVETGFRHASGMRDVPGCLGFEFWRSQEGGEYQVVTRWRSREDFDAWRSSEAFRHAHRDSGDSGTTGSRLVLYDVLIGG